MCTCNSEKKSKQEMHFGIFKEDFMQVVYGFNVYLVFKFS